MQSSDWDILINLIDSNPLKGVAVTQVLVDGITPAYQIEEIVGTYIFRMIRFLNGRKHTIQDDLGLVGVNALDLTKNHCFLTEGVSDSFAYRVVHPDENVLGITTLGGNGVSKKLLSNLFDSYTILTDNDSTGMRNVHDLRKWLVFQGKQVTIQAPPEGCKDTMQYLIKTLKINVDPSII